MNAKKVIMILNTKVSPLYYYTNKMLNNCEKM